MRTDRLKSLRQAKQYTQIELAEMLDLGSKEIWRYENGESVPNADTLAKIAQFLGVTMDYLMGLSDDPKPLYKSDYLTEREQSLVAAVRSGDKVRAIKAIVDDE